MLIVVAGLVVRHFWGIFHKEEEENDDGEAADVGYGNSPK